MIVKIYPAHTQPRKSIKPDGPSALCVLLLNLLETGSVTRVWLKPNNTYILQIILKVMFDVPRITAQCKLQLFGPDPFTSDNLYTHPPNANLN